MDPCTLTTHTTRPNKAPAIVVETFIIPRRNPKPRTESPSDDDCSSLQKHMKNRIPAAKYSSTDGLTATVSLETHSFRHQIRRNALPNHAKTLPGTLTHNFRPVSHCSKHFFLPNAISSRSDAVQKPARIVFCDRIYQMGKFKYHKKLS